MFDEVLRSLRAEGPSTTAELRERIPALAQRLELAPGKAYGGSFPIAPRLLGTLGCGRADPARGEQRRLARLAATVGADRGLARRAGATTPSRQPATGSWSSAGCAPSGRAPRPTSSGGWGRPRAPYAARWVSSVPWRSALARRGRLPAPRRPGRRTRAGAVGGAAAGARPHDDGLEAARVLPRRGGRAAPVRQQRQRRHHRLVGRAGSSAAGSRTTTGWSRSSSGTTSAPRAPARCDAEASRLTEWLDGHRVGTVYTSALMRSAR